MVSIRLFEYDITCIYNLSEQWLQIFFKYGGDRRKVLSLQTTMVALMRSLLKLFQQKYYKF